MIYNVKKVILLFDLKILNICPCCHQSCRNTSKMIRLMRGRTGGKMKTICIHNNRNTKNMKWCSFCIALCAIAKNNTVNNTVCTVLFIQSVCTIRQQWKKVSDDLLKWKKQVKLTLLFTLFPIDVVFEPDTGQHCIHPPQGLYTSI